MDYKAIMEIMEQEQENQPESETKQKPEKTSRWQARKHRMLILRWMMLSTFMQKRYRKMLFTLVT